MSLANLVHALDAARNNTMVAAIKDNMTYEEYVVSIDAVTIMVTKREYTRMTHEMNRAE